MFDNDLALRLFTAVDAVLATVVTLHVLRHKQDVRAAVGWIGIAWLSPLLGCALYWLFGINRVARRAARLKRDLGKVGANGPQVKHWSELPSHLAAIDAVAARTTGRTLLGGNAIVPFAHAEAAYERMLSAIASARHSVALASYIFRADAAGQRFIDALTAAHARGCAVRVLIDGVGGGYVRSAAARQLKRRGVPVGRFLHDWIPWRMPLVNLRNHRKILLVDGTTGFTGGLNVGAENLRVAAESPLVNDLHFEVVGPVVTQMMSVFAQDWEFTTGETLTGEQWLPRAVPAGDVFARVISEGPDDDLDTLEMLLLAAVNAARTRIRIVTPYFLPDQRVVFALTLAAFRGVDVEIAVPARTDSRPLDWAARVPLAELAGAGCRVFISPAPFDHAKVMTVDGAWALIGSANWDERSLRLNFELDLECYEGGLAAALDAIIDERLRRATQVTKGEFDRRPLPVQLRDAACRLFLPYL